MTAIVGILNRQAIAIAADSAVTINGKSTNRALKVFTLSKYQPVGIMIYNNASFMGVPWETIIKMYRQELQEKSYKTVKEYQESFIKYLQDKNYFTTDDFRKIWVRNTSVGVVGNIYQESIKIGALPLEQIIEQSLAMVNSYSELCPDFEAFSISDFKTIASDLINEACNISLVKKGVAITASILEKVTELLYKLFRSKNEYWSFTGLVFVGFGDDEIFPSLVPIKIYFAVINKLKYFVEDRRIVRISNDWRSSIQPFAQTEAMDTILTGVSSKLENTYVDNFKLFLDKYNAELIAKFGTGNDVFVQTINAIDTGVLRDEYRAKVEDAKNTDYINPLMGAVETLSKEDLAEMAESLIYLTYLQKRITLAAEDVGGNVDVAVISKGDGFIWIKRKNYFKEELNRHFMSNYFKK